MLRKGFFILLLSLFQPALAQAELNLERYAGKVVYLDFWASWCAPCRRSFPWMNEMLERYGDDGLVVIAVNVDSEPELAQAFLNEYPANFEVVHDPQGKLASRFELLGMPNSFLFNRKGEMVVKHVGFRPNRIERYEQEIKILLEE